MTSGEAGEREVSEGAQRAAETREVRVGDQECPRCHKRFTASYWSGGVMVQARCLSCDLKWPRPDMV